jgi:hypothetical protein
VEKLNSPVLPWLGSISEIKISDAGQEVREVASSKFSGVVCADVFAARLEEAAS